MTDPSNYNQSIRTISVNGMVELAKWLRYSVSAL